MSNAEEYFTYNDNFKSSVTNLLGIQTSLVVRTVSVRKDRFPWSPGSEISTKRGFHYSVQKLDNFKKWLNFPRKTLSSPEFFWKAGKQTKQMELQ
jgi:hypothetical protein